MFEALLSLRTLSAALSLRSSFHHNLKRSSIARSSQAVVRSPRRDMKHSARSASRPKVPGSRHLLTRQLSVVPPSPNHKASRNSRNPCTARKKNRATKRRRCRSQKTCSSWRLQAQVRCLIDPCWAMGWCICAPAHFPVDTRSALRRPRRQGDCRPVPSQCPLLISCLCPS